jgi:hypothetical protein
LLDKIMVHNEVQQVKELEAKWDNSSDNYVISKIQGV